MINDKEYALVLAGGGTKGAYQVGVWKALKELGVKITAISGASIGALNGALILQDDIDKMVELYENIKITDIMDLGEGVNPDKNIFDLSNLKSLAHDFIHNKGIANTPLGETIDKYIDIDKIYESNIDFGIVTLNLDKLEPVQIFKDQIERENMKDYLLASSCFPIFKPQKIGDKKFVDGGMYDNIPMNMLIKKGYSNFIIADVSGLGLSRKNIDRNVYFKIISPKENLGGTFEFNHDRIRYNIKLGYLDTLRSFNKLQGHTFYFPQEDFARMLDVFTLQTIHGLEEAAQIYKMEVTKIYNFEEFLTELSDRHQKAKIEYEKIKTKLNIKNVLDLKSDINKILDEGMVICFVNDIYLDKPMSRKFERIRKIFEGYTESVEALIELENYFNMEME